MSQKAMLVPRTEEVDASPPPEASHQIHLFGQVVHASTSSCLAPTRLSAQASKRLPSLVAELKHAWEAVCSTVFVAEVWSSLCTPAMLQSFWGPLQAYKGPSGPELEVFYEAVCGLLYVFSSVQVTKVKRVQDLLERLDCDLQAAASVVVRCSNPELFTTTSPNILHWTRELLKERYSIGPH